MFVLLSGSFHHLRIPEYNIRVTDRLFSYFFFFPLLVVFPLRPISEHNPIVKWPIAIESPALNNPSH